MTISRACRWAVGVLAVGGLGVALLGANRSSVEAAAKVPPPPKPIVLVVDSRIASTGLTTSTVISKGSALLPIHLGMPTYLPVGDSLSSVSIERPLTGYTVGTATLSFQASNGAYVFEVDEAPLPFVYGRAKATATTIHGVPAVIYDLGTIGKSHLMAIAVTYGGRSLEITSNVGLTKLTQATLIQIIGSVT